MWNWSGPSWASGVIGSFHVNPYRLSIDNDKILWHTEDGQVLFCIQILYIASCQASYVPTTTGSGAFPHSRTKMRADRGGMGAICVLSISFYPSRKQAGHTNHKVSYSFLHHLCKRYNTGSSRGVPLLTPLTCLTPPCSRQAPTSMCTEPCQPGERRLQMNRHQCCFSCVACPSGTFLNTSGQCTPGGCALPFLPTGLSSHWLLASISLSPSLFPPALSSSL